MEYDKLTKSQKIAAFLIVIGPEAAAEVMKHFDNGQLEQICREMSELSVIDLDVRNSLLAEFAGVVATGAGNVLGGPQFAQVALERAKGNYAASVILDRVAPAGRTMEGGDDIRQMEARQILNLIKSEQPQTIAFVMSYLDVPKAAEITMLLPQDMREEVMERLGSMEETSSEIVGKIAKNLNRHLDKKSINQSLHRGGGVKSTAEILNQMDKETRNIILTRLEERNASLGSAIRKKCFGFENLVRLSPADLQRVMRDVDSADLTIALKNAKPALLTAIMGAMSRRAAESLKDDIEMSKPMKAKEIEAAQDRVIQVVRRLDEAEEITIETGGE